MNSISEKMKTAAVTTAVKKAVDYLEKDPEANAVKVMDMVDALTPGDWYGPQRQAIREVIESRNNWYRLVMKIFDLDPGVRRAFIQNFLINASLVGSAVQEDTARREDCNVPWAILLDPTSACNLRCTGCWAAEYGNRLNLTLDEMDSIVRQGKELGTYMYIFTGGEPLVRKADILALCERHPDCEFLSFTNGTLIDEQFCEEMLRVKNFVPALSVEGFETATDGRRGGGTYQKVVRAMKLLKSHGLPFGISTCYTGANFEDVTSEAYFDQMIDWGALFVWYFHYMPVGKGAVPALLPTPEQRAEVYRRIRAYRETKAIFSMDFQNDAEYVGGCIAGGRRYLHISAAGDVEPCVFIHYSNVNIRSCTLLEALKSPLFMAYHRNQPFNDNMLRPCPMLENPEKLRAMVRESGARSTDYESPEDVDTLCDRAEPYAAAWAPAAEALWRE
ncbi:MAG: radical SAM protein [Oscillospiraceae bacterium]|nr:radical SAM protein [Oscillospiraceae bacterium]